MISWFAAPEEYSNFAAKLEPMRVLAEGSISAKDHVDCYCWACGDIKHMLVRSGAMLGNNPNLREGLLCEDCGLSNRARLMHLAILAEYQDLTCSSGELLILERTSPLYKALANKVNHIIGSEYLGDGHIPGKQYTLKSGDTVRHESITALSFHDDSISLMAHSDVLEHVYDYKKALAESYRVLAPGGRTIFTCPFFAQRHEPLIRSVVDEKGNIIHIEPPEYHGDPLNTKGILTYYHYGWGLLDALRQSGFKEVALGVIYDVYAGFVSNNYPNDSYGLMLPIVIRAVK